MERMKLTVPKRCVASWVGGRKYAVPMISPSERDVEQIQSQGLFLEFYSIILISGEWKHFHVECSP